MFLVSLKEAVQDPSVKPKLQCLMVDPSFSMVTVQSEDSGIVWETASSRCSTPWASEGSSPSEQYSLEGSGTQGNIVIIMDEDRIKRKKTSSRGKLGERFKKSGSKVPKSRVGEERPAMIEVAVPNIRSESSEDDLSAVSKDQDLFSLISEGFEILNIVVPSKLATVDEEDSTELAENLAYLDNTPKIKSKPKHEPLGANGYCVSTEAEETKQNESLNDSSQISDDKQSKKDETQMDYLEKFTLLDEQAPSDGAALTENIVAEWTVQPEEPQVNQKESKADEAIEEDSFVIISDVEIAGEHLDEVFYGNKSNAEPVAPQEHGRITRQSSKSLKESGSVLFGSQECILTPVYLPTGPPKIIDPVLLEEPRAMSFHYSDLYEDAIGDRKKEDDVSDTESVVSERSFKRRYSDSDDGDGYLEKFTLKDETPAAVRVPEDRGEVDGGILVWPQSKFELTGCLEKAQEESDEVTVEQPCVQDKNESEVKCESTGCCSNGHCGPEIHPKVEVIIREKVTLNDLVAKHSREDIKQCDITVKIKDSITTKSESDNKQPPQVVEPKNKIKEEHDRQKQKGLTARTEVPVSLEHEDVSKTKDEFKILSLTKSSENTQADIPHEVEKIGVSKTSIGKNEALDVIADIQKMNIITNFDKGEKDETQSKILDKDIIQRVDKGITEIVKSEAPGILAQEVISTKETPLDKTERQKAKELPRVEKEDKSLKETSEASGAKHSAKSMEKGSQVHQKEKALAVVEEKVSEGLIPKSEKQEEVIDSIGVVQQAKVHSSSTEVFAGTKIKPESEITAILRASEQSHSSKIVTANTELQTKPEITNEKKMPSELQKDSSSANNKAKEDIYVERPTAEAPILKQGMEKQKELIHIPEIEPEVTEKHEKVEEIKVDVVEDSNKKAQTTQEPVQVEIPSDSRVTAEVKDIVESRQECSLLVIEKEASAPEGTEKMSKTADVEDSSKVRLSSVVPTKEVQLEEHSKINDVTTEISVKENSENQILPLVSTLEKGKKPQIDVQIEDITDLPEPLSPPPQVDEKNSSAMRVSPLEPEDSDKAYEDIHAGGMRLSRNKGVFSQLRSYTPQEDLSALSCNLDVQRDIAEELDYEMIDEQEARQSEQARAEDGKICMSDQALEMGFEFVEDLDSAQLVDEREEDVEIQPMDAFCLDCHCPILLSEAEHQNHKVASLDEAFDSMKVS